MEESNNNSSSRADADSSEMANFNGVTKQPFSEISRSLFFQCSKEMWNGFIPIEFVIASVDLAALTTPEPCFVLSSRMAYLPIIAADAVEYFRHHAIELSSDVWFEYENVGLKCNVPVGSLFDLHSKNSLSTDCIQPWTITVHFQSFPSETLLPCCTVETSEKFFSHSLKQALHLLHGSTRLFNSLSETHRLQLWEASSTGSRGIFEQVARDLRPSKDDCRAVPVRLLFPHRATVQKPLQCRTADGSDATLGSALDELTRSVPGLSICVDATGIEKSADVALDAEASLGAAMVPRRERATRWLVQGVEVPLSAPLYHVWHLLAHADLFLYIVYVGGC